MSKRAEAAALKAYPPTYTTVKRYAKKVQSERVDTRQPARSIFQQGYEQAEKDLALTWEDVAILITIYEQEVEAGNISRYEDEGAPSLKEASEIILRKFNEIRKNENTRKHTHRQHIPHGICARPDDTRPSKENEGQG